MHLQESGQDFELTILLISECMTTHHKPEILEASHLCIAIGTKHRMRTDPRMIWEMLLEDVKWVVFDGTDFYQDTRCS